MTKSEAYLLTDLNKEENEIKIRHKKYLIEEC